VIKRGVTEHSKLQKGGKGPAYLEQTSPKKRPCKQRLARKLQRKGGNRHKASSEKGEGGRSRTVRETLRGLGMYNFWGKGHEEV